MKCSDILDVIFKVIGEAFVVVLILRRLPIFLTNLFFKNGNKR